MGGYRWEDTGESPGKGWKDTCWMTQVGGHMCEDKCGRRKMGGHRWNPRTEGGGHRLDEAGGKSRLRWKAMVGRPDLGHR